MKPTIETSRIRANLRLYAEMGHIPSELVPTIERALGLDYVAEEYITTVQTKETNPD